MASSRDSIQLRRKWLWYSVAVYGVLLLASHAVRIAHRWSDEGQGGDSVSVNAPIDEAGKSPFVRIAYSEYGARGGSTPVVLIHGSPGNRSDFERVAPALAEDRRVLAPDLPGFGRSTRKIPDYSIRAHAHYVIQFLDALEVGRFHLVGFSMGGGVALMMAEAAPDRIESLTLLSSVGVQEMELLGDYEINHALHGLQLAALWGLRELTPHMGWLDDALIGVPYARNFYDTDQRPLRGIISRLEVPVLIIHGEKDILIPVEAAREHHRLIPQSELLVTAGNHFTVFTDPGVLSSPIGDFINRVDSGRAASKGAADAARLARANEPFNPATAPKAAGLSALIVFTLISVATLISEDLTSIAAGVMVGHGRIGLTLAVVSCFFGIFVGDLLLFAAGRYLGRPALSRPPLKWFIRRRDVEASSAWFTRRGLPVILASRFVPGMRLPTYFAAGMLQTSFWFFFLYFLAAGVVWTPLLVGISAYAGGEVLRSRLFGASGAFGILLAVAFVYVVVSLALRAGSFRGRRMLVSRWRRLTRWEFWPPWIFYAPVFFYYLYLALRHRSLTAFTAANPAIESGGFIGESKSCILEGLGSANGIVARAGLVPAALSIDERIKRADAIRLDQALEFPVVLKPDRGQRGSGVAIVGSSEELAGYLKRTEVDTIVQEYVPGLEFGVFYYRRPGVERGRIFAITEKRFPIVIGDGRRTLEQLILGDSRAVAMAPLYLEKQRARLSLVPQAGEVTQLVEIGTHCRGAIFLDGGRIRTDEMELTIDLISRRFDGFHFGRYDLRTPSLDDFKQGKNFKVIELNGVTSEATNIYDPANSLLDAYRVLFAQWRLAFEIGAENIRRGATPARMRDLIRSLLEYRKDAGSHPE